MHKEKEKDYLAGETVVMPSLKVNTVSSSQSSRSGATGRHASDKPKGGSAHLKKTEEDQQPDPQAQVTLSPQELNAFKKKKRKKRIIFATVMFAVIVFIVFAAFSIRSVYDSKVYDSYYSRAMECYAAGDYNSALGYFRKAAKISASDELQLLIAECYTNDGNYSMAIEILRGLDTTDPEIAELIQENEAKRASADEKTIVTIGGKDYDISTASLDLSDCGLTNEDISRIGQLYSLTSLNISNNISVSDISPLAELGGLHDLDISGCSVSSLSSLSSLTELHCLYADRCSRITDLTPIYSLTSLSLVSLRWTYLSDETVTALSTALPGCAVRSGNDPADEPFTITFSGISFSSGAEELDLADKGLTDITVLSACTNLRSLDLSNNSITDISSLVDIPALENLYLSGNNISNIYPLMGLTTLKVVDLSRNPVSDIAAMSYLEELRELYLSGAPLTSLSGIQYLNYLETLDISSTELLDEHLSALSSIFSLRTLNIENCPNITGTAVDSLSSILINCRIIHSELPYPVEFGGETFLDTDTEIYLSGKNIEDITPLKNIKHPEKVDLSNNDISDISRFEFIPSVTYIKELDLSGNSITDVTPTMWLASIEILDLSGNPIDNPSSLVLLTSLKHLYISGTNLTDEQILTICNALPNCTVHYQDS